MLKSGDDRVRVKEGCGTEARRTCHYLQVQTKTTGNTSRVSATPILLAHLKTLSSTMPPRRRSDSTKDSATETPVSVSEPAKPKRGRGRPRKDGTAGASATEPELTPQTGVPLGGHTAPQTKTKVAKRKAASAPEPNLDAGGGEDSTQALAAKPTKKPRPTPNPPPRQPLPDRTSRTQTPGGPDKPRAKRTSAQVKADKAEVERRKQEVVDLDRRRVELLAELELDEEDEDAEEDRDAVRTLADVRQDVSGENFDFTEVNAMETTESEADEDTEVSGKKKKGKASAGAAKKGVSLIIRSILERVTDWRRYYKEQSR